MSEVPEELGQMICKVVLVFVIYVLALIGALDFDNKKGHHLFALILAKNDVVRTDILLT